METNILDSLVHIIGQGGGEGLLRSDRNQLSCSFLELLLRLDWVVGGGYLQLVLGLYAVAGEVHCIK